MSSFYLDILKDRLYTSGTDSLLRRAAQTVLYEIVNGLIRLMSPILSFTATEAWESLHGLDQKAPLEQSVFFVGFPEAKEYGFTADMDAKWTRLMKIRSEITKALEIARREKVIGHPLEANVLLAGGGQYKDFINQEWVTLKEISIISELTSTDGLSGENVFVSEEIEGLSLAVQPASGSKCERCWTRSTTVGENSEHPQICARCAGVVTGVAA